MSTTAERMARVETRVEQLYEATRELHAELREHLALERRWMEHSDQRVSAVERAAEETRTHLRWMKAVWAAVQGAVLALLGLR